MMRSYDQQPARRAFTLMEALVVVIVLAMVVPLGMQMLTESEEARRQSTGTAKAVTLAQGVLEQVTADTHSSDALLGFDALADSNAYQTTAVTGLVARMAWIDSPYTAQGITWALSIGALVDSTGVTTGDVNEDVFRQVTVTVSYPGMDGRALNLPVTTVVTGLR